MTLVPTCLGHSLHPVGIIVPVVVLSPTLVVVQLVDIGCSRRILCRVVEFLLHQHSIFITRQEVVTTWLPCTLERVRVIDSDLTTRTTLGLDADDTIGATRAPDSGSSGILHDVDALDIVHVDGKQGAIGFLCRCREIDILGIWHIHDVAIDNDQRLRRTIDGGDTTHTHRSTCTQVTRVGNDVKTCDLTLQSLIGAGERKTFDIDHVHGLCSYRNLVLRNAQTIATEA